MSADRRLQTDTTYGAPASTLLIGGGHGGSARSMVTSRPGLRWSKGAAASQRRTVHGKPTFAHGGRRCH